MSENIPCFKIALVIVGLQVSELKDYYDYLDKSIDLFRSFSITQKPPRYVYKEMANEVQIWVELDLLNIEDFKHVNDFIDDHPHSDRISIWMDKGIDDNTLFPVLQHFYYNTRISGLDFGPLNKVTKKSNDVLFDFIRHSYVTRFDPTFIDADDVDRLQLSSLAHILPFEERDVSIKTVGYVKSAAKKENI